MKYLLLQGWIVAAGLTLAAATYAEPAPAASVADPLQPAAAVPPVAYTSSFARYRAVRDAEVGSWREANDTVARIGGWRTYAREASRPEAATAAPEGAPAAPAAPEAAPLRAAPTAPGHGRH